MKRKKWRIRSKRVPRKEATVGKCIFSISSIGRYPKNENK